MKNFIKEWQGLWALIAVGIAFFCVPRVFQAFGMNAGVIDPAYVHALVFTVGVFFTAIFCAWVALQLDWKIVDRYISEDKLQRDWDYLNPLHRLVITFSIIGFLIAVFVACYFALPKP